TTTSQRITIATLDTQVTSLSQAVKRYPGIISMSPAQQTQQALTWLVRFQINEELARQAGITVSTAQAQAALAATLAAAKAQAAAAGVTNASPDLILAANGIPPDLATELGRYQAINAQYVKNANGGTLPTSTAAQASTTAQLQHATCLAAKSLQIQVNPQFGQMDYSQYPYQVVSAPSPVSRTPGPAPTTSPSGQTPVC
ncbi:MAG: hypothetical protein JO037_05890, partial [Actinobacteria bacterium]|nr:hypothetical protein [Actinomycetota bacterium]